MSAEKELIVAPPQETALAVYSADKGLEPWLEKIRVKIDEFLAVVPDLKTVKGRKEIASMAYEVARTKTAIENKGKELSTEQKKVPGRIDAERKRVWDILETWQKEVRKPLDDWQKTEDARVDRHNARIEQLRGLADVETLFALGIRSKIENVESVVIDDGFEEFEAEAHQTKAKTLEFLRAALAKREAYEAEQAELERLREESAARAKADHEAAIARAAVEKAQQEAAAAAQAERDAAARREQALIDQAAQAQREADQKARDAEAAAANQALHLKLQAEQAARAAEQAEANRIAAEQRAKQDRIAAEQRQAAAVEQARLAEVARAEAAAREQQRLTAAREADKAHKGAIYKAAKEAFMQHGMTEDCARLAVKLIASNFIPAISIKY